MIKTNYYKYSLTIVIMTYFFASFITNTGEPGTSVWTCKRDYYYYMPTFNSNLD